MYNVLWKRLPVPSVNPSQKVRAGKQIALLLHVRFEIYQASEEMMLF